MNKKKWIKKQLYQANACALENSKLTEIKSDKTLPNITWYDLDHLEQAPLGYPVYFDATQNKVALTNTLSHACIVSSTGKGKSTVLIENWVEIFSRYPLDRRPTLILTDPKGELSTLLIPELKEKYNCLVLNLIDQAAGNVRINPLFEVYQSHHAALALEKERDKLDMVKDEQAWLDLSEQIEYHKDKADDLAHRFAHNCCPIEKYAKEQTWNQGGRNLIVGTIKVTLYESEDPENHISATRFTPGLIADVLASTQDDCEELITLFQKYKHDADVRKAASYFSLNARQTRDSYISTATTGLSPYSSRQIRRLTSQNTLDFEAIARGDQEKPVALFIVSDDKKPAKNELLKFAVEHLLDTQQTVADNQPDGTLSRIVVYILDEFCNAPCLDKVMQAVTISRSRGIYIAAAIQNYQQMADRYTENLTNTFLDNCNLNICLGCNHQASKDRFAKEFGKAAYPKESYSLSESYSCNLNLYLEEKPVLRVSDIDSLTLGQFFALFEGHGYRSYMTPYFMRPGLNHQRKALPRLNRCVEDYLPQPIYDIEEANERARRKNPSGFFRDAANTFGLYRESEDAREADSEPDEDLDEELEEDEELFEEEEKEENDESDNTSDSEFDAFFEEFMKKYGNGSS